MELVAGISASLISCAQSEIVCCPFSQLLYSSHCDGPRSGSPVVDDYEHMGTTPFMAVDLLKQVKEDDNIKSVGDTSADLYHRTRTYIRKGRRLIFPLPRINSRRVGGH